MRVVAYTYVRNEADIIEETIEHMLRQGCEVYVLDNWSTDGTDNRLLQRNRDIRWEHWPEKPSEWFELGVLLRRIEEVHSILRPDWGLLFGADELLESPWPDVSLHETLGYIWKEGYTAAPAVEAVFHPTDDGWRPGMSRRSYFRYWSFGNQRNVRAWHSPEVRFVDGGHDVAFQGYKLWPEERLVLRHYPYRNQEQATRKVFVERKPRYAPAERAIGWHTHLDAIKPGHCFIQPKSGLHEYDEETFCQEVQQWPRAS